MGIKCLGLLLSVVIVTMAQPASRNNDMEPVADSPPDPALKAFSSGVNQFALSLLKAAVELKGADKNVLVSPLSASLATAMLYQGAKGSTKAEIQSGLKLPSEDAQFERGVSFLNDNLNNTPNVTLEVANRVYLDMTFEGKLKSSYQDALTKIHKSSLVIIDLGGAPEPSRAEINKWVSDKTHDKIKDLLPSGSIDANTAMVLVNALYFKGKWKKQFDPKDTVTLPFYLTKDQQVNVSMMHRTGNMQYAEVPELQAKVLSLPYEGDKINMVLVLPNEIDGLSGVVDKLTSGQFNLENVQFYHPEVRLWLPKFKLEDTHDLKSVYQKLNMGNMFSSGADFSGIVDPPPHLSVGAAVQKSFMEVNEEGTEAAAATAVSLGNRVMVKPVNLTVDHPFLIFIKMASADRTANSTLFAGVLSRPTAQKMFAPLNVSDSPVKGIVVPVPTGNPNATGSSVANGNRSPIPEKPVKPVHEKLGKPVAEKHVPEITEKPAPEITEKPAPEITKKAALEITDKGASEIIEKTAPVKNEVPVSQTSAGPVSKDVNEPAQKNSKKQNQNAVGTQTAGDYAADGVTENSESSSSESSVSSTTSSSDSNVTDSSTTSTSV